MPTDMAVPTSRRRFSSFPKKKTMPSPRDKGHRHHSGEARRYGKDRCARPDPAALSGPKIQTP